MNHLNGTDAESSDDLAAAMQIPADQRLRASPRRPQPGEPASVSFKLSPNILSAIDKWRITEFPDGPSRSEAVKRLVEREFGKGRKLYRYSGDRARSEMARVETKRQWWKIFGSGA